MRTKDLTEQMMTKYIARPILQSSTHPPLTSPMKVTPRVEKQRVSTCFDSLLKIV
jgi:hypothetical protein